LAESDFDPPFIRNAPRSLELNSLHWLSRRQRSPYRYKRRAGMGIA